MCDQLLLGYTAIRLLRKVMQLSDWRGELAEETNSRVHSWLCPVAFILLLTGDLLCLVNSGAWIAGPPTVACGAAALIVGEKYRERKGGRRANSSSPSAVSVFGDLLTSRAKEKAKSKDQESH
jgi:hypothetical protein